MSIRNKKRKRAFLRLQKKLAQEAELSSAEEKAEKATEPLEESKKEEKPSEKSKEAKVNKKKVSK